MKGLLLFILITIGVSASAQDEVLSVIDGALDSLVADGGLVEDENIVGDSLIFPIFSVLPIAFFPNNNTFLEFILKLFFSNLRTFVNDILVIIQ